MAFNSRPLIKNTPLFLPFANDNYLKTGNLAIYDLILPYLFVSVRPTVCL